jgi:hypothetical protein
MPSDRLSLSQLAKAVGMSPSDLAVALRRGNVPGIPATASRTGRSRYLDLGECVHVAIFAALRRLSAGNRLLGERARYAAPQAAQVLGELLLGRQRTASGLAIITRPDGREIRRLVPGERGLAALVARAFAAGDTVEILPFSPVFQRLMSALAEASGVAAAATMPGATARGPEMHSEKTRKAPAAKSPEARRATVRKRAEGRKHGDGPG